MSLSRIFLILILTGSLVFLNACSSGDVVKSDPDLIENRGVIAREAKVGSLAPDFELAKLDGTKVSFNDIEGNPAVIVFWTAWCPSCKEEAPHINKLAEEFDGNGVRVLGINIGEGEARVKEGIKDFGIKYDVLRDADTSVAKRYNVVGTPTVVFLDEDGVVRYFGNELPKDYHARLEQLLGN
jgi:peroxiredoxin